MSSFTPKRQVVNRLSVFLLLLPALLGVLLQNGPAEAVGDNYALNIYAINYSTDIEGFATRDSVLPGESLNLKVSSTEYWRVDFFRVGSYRGKDAKRYGYTDWLAPSNIAKTYTRNESTRTPSAPWSVSYSTIVGAWPTGFYYARLTTRSGKQNLIPFVVKSKSVKGKTVVVSGFATYHTYNEWSGVSGYSDTILGDEQRSLVVSMDRPFDRKGLDTVQAYEYTTAVAVDRSGVPAVWTTGEDVSLGVTRLNGAVTIVSPGHDEYWSQNQRDKVQQQVRDRNVNLLVFGANTGYWRIRFEGLDETNWPRQVAIYRDNTLDPVGKITPSQGTIRFEDSPGARPIAELTGLTYNCFPTKGDFVVSDASWWGYQGTGVVNGQKFIGLVGSESDRFTGSPLPGVKSIVVADSPITCKGKSLSQSMSYSVFPGGAGVVATGSMGWPCAMAGRCPSVVLATSAFTQKVTRNLLREAAKGPLGVLHPLA